MVHVYRTDKNEVHSSGVRGGGVACAVSKDEVFG